MATKEDQYIHCWFNKKQLKIIDKKVKDHEVNSRYDYVKKLVLDDIGNWDI